MKRHTTGRAIRRAASLLVGVFVLLLAAEGAQAASCPFVAGNDYSGSTGNFVGVSCKNANLTPVTLTSLNLSNANFQNAVIQTSVLDYANLSGATLQNTDFTNSSMVGVNFGNANVKSAIFTGVNLAGADLSSVKFNGGTTWTGAIFTSTTKLPFSTTVATTTYGMILPEPKIGLLLVVAAALFILPRLDHHT